MTYCANCGTGLPDDCRFCSDCGTTITQIPATVANPFPQPIVPQVQEFYDSTSKTVYQTNDPVQEKNYTNKKELIYCRNCSNPLYPNAFACTKCGLPPLKGRNHCQCCGADTHPEAVMCVKCGVMLENHAVKKVAEIEPYPIIYHQPVQQIPQQVVVPPSSYTQQNITVIGKQKSVGTAFLLAFLFGPLGLLYATVTGGLIMIFVGIAIAVLTLGVGSILTWVICIIWAVVATNEANSKIGS